MVHTSWKALVRVVDRKFGMALIGVSTQPLVCGLQSKDFEGAEECGETLAGASAFACFGFRNFGAADQALIDLAISLRGPSNKTN
jgi:hypothetical protein